MRTPRAVECLDRGLKGRRTTTGRCEVMNLKRCPNCYRWSLRALVGTRRRVCRHCGYEDLDG